MRSLRAGATPTLRGMEAGVGPQGVDDPRAAERPSYRGRMEQV